MVVKPISFKVFYVIAIALDWFVHYVDIKTTFLNVDIKETTSISGGKQSHLTTTIPKI